MKIGKTLFGIRIKDKQLEERVTKYLQSIPNEHLDGIRKIVRPVFVNENCFYDGRYNRLTGNIGLGYYFTESTLYHEVGHHLFYRMSKSTKDTFLEIYKKLDERRFCKKDYWDIEDPNECFAKIYEESLLYNSCNQFDKLNYPEPLKKFMQKIINAPRNSLNLLNTLS